MYNDITPRRGAVRSTSRPPAARPIPAFSRQALQRPYGAPVPPEETTSGAAPLPIQPTPPPLPTTRRMQDIAPTSTPRPVPNKEPVFIKQQSPPQEEQVAPPTPKTEPVKKKRKWYQFSKRSLFVILPIVLVVGAGSYIGVDAWLASSRSKTQLTPIAQAASPKDSQAAEGTDVAKLPDTTLTNYVVAADLPRIIRIEKLQVAARILPMGVNKDNSMQAPVNINDSGWYTGSSKPGVAGAVVIDGHSSATNSAEHLGLFNALDTLENGDIVTIEKGDGTTLSYKVIYKETVKLDAIDMKKVMLPYGSAKEGLNLITCAGQWTAKNTTLDHRTIVYTERITT